MYSTTLSLSSWNSTVDNLADFVLGPVVAVYAVVKGSASLPCDMTPPQGNDSVLLVVWYKNDTRPVYR